MVLTLELELPAQISSMSPLSSDLFSVPPVARPTLLPRPGPRQSWIFCIKIEEKRFKMFFFVFWYLISSKHPFLDQSFTVKYWAMPRPPLGTDLLSQDPVVLVNVTTWSCMTMTSFIKASLFTIEYLQRPGVRYQPGSVHGLLVELGVVPEVEAVKHSQTGHDPQHSLRWGLICCRKNEMTMDRFL